MRGPVSWQTGFWREKKQRQVSAASTASTSPAFEVLPPETSLGRRRVGRSPKRRSTPASGHGENYLCHMGRRYGCGSKPRTPGEHQNRWYMGVHPPQNAGIVYDPWPCGKSQRNKTWMNHGWQVNLMHCSGLFHGEALFSFLHPAVAKGNGKENRHLKVPCFNTLKSVCHGQARANVEPRNGKAGDHLGPRS